MTSDNEKMNFSFYLILNKLNKNLNSYIWLMSTILNSTVCDQNHFISKQGNQVHVITMALSHDLAVSTEPDKGSGFYTVFHPWHNTDHAKYFMNVC